MWTIIEIGVNFFQGGIMIYFMKHRLHLKDKYRIQEICSIVGITLFLSLYYFFSPSFPDTFVFIIPFIFALTSSKDSWYISMFWSCILAVLFLTTVPIVFNIFAVFPNISVIAYSILETAKANGLNPEKYLMHIFSVLPDRFVKDPKAYIEDLLPWNAEIKELCKMGV